MGVHVLNGLIYNICEVYIDDMLIFGSYDETFLDNTRTVFQRCRERNVYLKMSKSWLGFPSAKFYGYIVEQNSFRLSDERKLAIQQIPFPRNQKQARSVLGSGVFFKPFVPHYSTITASLYDLTKDDFSWNQAKWTVDYITIFNEWKVHLANSLNLFYPNYDLVWRVRPDASEVGVGGVIFQEVPKQPSSEIIKKPAEHVDATVPPPTLPDNEVDLQPIFVWCQKLSKAAKDWKTIEQECYSIYSIFRIC